MTCFKRKKHLFLLTTKKNISHENHVMRVGLNKNNVFAYLESLGYDNSKLVKYNDNILLYYYIFKIL